MLTLADLTAWSRPGTSLAVLGHPIKHWISPPMHNAALAELARADARFADWQYFRFEIHPDNLTQALDLLHAKKFRGVNLTVPHKIIAFDRVAEVDPAARPSAPSTPSAGANAAGRASTPTATASPPPSRPPSAATSAGSASFSSAPAVPPAEPPSSASSAAAPRSQSPTVLTAISFSSPHSSSISRRIFSLIASLARSQPINPSRTPS